MDIHDRIREWWDADARTYDDSASHAISDPLEAATWRAALTDALPEPGARVLDVGAGTGAMSLLAAELGFEVTALDVSEGMLAMARSKAAERGLDIAFEVGSAMAPPAGPFDAVIERHVLWTMPDPAGALRAWREVTRPGGRLVLFEGVWGGAGPLDRARDLVADAIQRLLRIPDDHHAPYPDEVLRSLPLAGQRTPRRTIDAVHEAGWRGVRLKRLRDVEWAQRLRGHPLLGWLDQRPRYMLVATA